MENKKKIYWKGIEQLNKEPEFLKYQSKEFPEYLPVNGEKVEGSGSSRRDFLKLMGFSVAAASLAACEAPVRKAIPYLNKPVEVDPGIANYYASTYINGGDYCSILVKTREGRPIKIEGNKLSKISGGGTSAQVEASVLSLYDKARITDPFIGEAKSSWEEVDTQIKTKLASIVAKGGKIAIVSKTILSPTTRRVIDEFIAKYPGSELVVYDPISSNGLLNANAISFGKRAVPNYAFNKVDVVVSFSADFLGTWINPIKFAADFAQTRKLGKNKKAMSRLYSFESNLSLTGSNADYRIPVRSSSEGLLVVALYNEVLKKAGLPVTKTNVIEEAASIQKAANDLWNARGKSLVVSGSNDENVQIVVNKINDLLGNYGKTIDLVNHLNLRQGDDTAMSKFVDSLNGGRTNGVIFLNCNPVYDHFRGAEISEAIGKLDLSVSTSDRIDETADISEYKAPDHHFLESWNDAEPARGSFSLTQPTISPLFNTRQSGDSLLSWAGAGKSYYDFLQENWKENQFASQSKESNFQHFWDQSLHDGVFTTASSEETEELSFNVEISNVLQSIAKNYTATNSNPELVLYTKISMGDGSQANNPWLQELPDPISKACWDNYLTVSQKWAEENGVKMVESKTKLGIVSANGSEFKLPILVQPGQKEGTFGIALGYGRKKAGKVAENIGVNVFPLLGAKNANLNGTISEGVALSVTTEEYDLAQTQTHHTFMARENVIQEATLSDYKNDPEAGRFHPHIATSDVLAKELGLEKGSVPPRAISLWKGHEYPNHHWAMAIDLNSCTGCSACTISCQAENNVPVVGKDEVVARREMHWIRIDRYYSSDADKSDRIGLEKASSNPEVTFMPMMCQQCNNAPCETVCPVAATTHSTEGLNQMTYNRCIGTRYCANNCPYKVRRFNWFKYHDNNDRFDMNSSMSSDLGKMVLNPDVTVRSRGVMEKCSFCVQRIQAGKLEAKKEGRRPVDGEITTACASACPTNAIVFGDLKDPNSKVVELLQFEESEKFQEVKEPRAFNVLEDINVKPNIWYFTKIRNKDEELA